MYSFTTNTRVRYSETDQMGYVYYGNYASFYEIGRVELFRSLGTSYRALEESGIMMPVYEMKCKYILPAKYDDEIFIKTSILKKPSMRIVFNYEVFDDKNTLLNKGETTLVFVDMKSNKLTKLPEVLSAPLNKYFKE